MLGATPAPAALVALLLGLEATPSALGEAVPLAAVAVDVLEQLAVRMPLAVPVALDEGVAAAVVATTCTATMHGCVPVLSHRTVRWYVKPARPTPCACMSSYTALALLPPGAMVYVRHSQSEPAWITVVVGSPTQRNVPSNHDGVALAATASVTVYWPLS